MRLVLCTLVLALAACPSTDEARPCHQSDDCLQGGVPGTCLPSPDSSNMWCAYPDPTCDGSELRYGYLAGDGLSRTCVAAGDAGPVDAGADADITDGATPDGLVLTDEMATVSAGPFNRGCNASQQDCSLPRLQYALPYSQVTLSAFSIDKHEVTQSEYADCLDAGQCTAPGCGSAFNPDDTPNFPVVCVTWEQANTYCAWKGKRLPTEAEWEKAARGTDGRKWPWGNTPNPNCSLAHLDTCTEGPGIYDVSTHLAGDSPYGVHDMAGNVAEWVADWYSTTYYTDGPSTNPPGPTSGTEKVVRGGSLHDSVWATQTSWRNYYDPATTWPDGAAPSLGFRCAKSE